MMKWIMLFFCSLVLVVSCSYAPMHTVTVSLYQDSPWEQETGRMMWFKLKYFDGKKVNTIYLEEGERSVQVPVSTYGVAVFALYPLGDLSPFGGFSSGLDKREVFLYPEYGSFASMLLDAAEARPLVVSEVNMEKVIEDYPDLLAVNRQEAISSLYDGTWNQGKFSLAKRFSVPLEGVLTGRWISLLSNEGSFVKKSISTEMKLSLFPGVWYYLNPDRDLMLTILLTEEGEYWMKLREAPVWY